MGAFTFYEYANIFPKMQVAMQKNSGEEERVIIDVNKRKI